MNKFYGGDSDWEVILMTAEFITKLALSIRLPEISFEEIIGLRLPDERPHIFQWILEEAMDVDYVTYRRLEYTFSMDSRSFQFTSYVRPNSYEFFRALSRKVDFLG